jgi:uncharacterized protein (TIGR02246 family)
MYGEARTEDRRLIEPLIGSLEAAWARGDADAYANRFANDGTFTNFLGMFFQGREAFRERHDSVFKTVFKGTVLTLRIAALRFVRSDVAIADLDAEVRGVTDPPANLAGLRDSMIHTRLLIVLVKEHEGWWISAYHNVPVA